MKYKIGDRVKVREDLKEGEGYGALLFMYEMQIPYVTIRLVSDRYYNVEETSYKYTDEMLEDVPDINVVKSNKKLGQEPAFPVEVTYGEEGITGRQTDIICGFETGMSKRLYIATAAMQAMVNGRCASNSYISPKEIANDSFILADEMLKQEEVTE